MLDLRHIFLADHDIARFATKREAAVLARKRGLDVIRAYNRFNTFWVVGSRDPDDLRLATRASGLVSVPYHPDTVTDEDYIGA